MPLTENSLITSGQFVSQPPDNLRKCSFFNFSITLLGANEGAFQIESASFLTFIEVTEVCMPTHHTITTIIIVELLMRRTDRLVITIRLNSTLFCIFFPMDGIQ